MTRNSVHPYRNPHSGENASRRYTYWPPAFGIIAASSPYESAAVRVSNPVTIQTTSNHPGEPTWRAMIDETMKIPEPIIDPATSIVESNNPSPLTSFSSARGASVTALVISNPWIGGELIINRLSGAMPKNCLNHFTVKNKRVTSPPPMTSNHLLRARRL